MECIKCGHEWIARTEMPLACPKCRSYKWNDDAIETGYSRDVKGRTKDGRLKLGKKKPLKKA